MNDECEFCESPDNYGLLPAESLNVPVWATTMGAKGGGGPTMIHPPKHPVSNFVGVRCKKDPNQKFI